MEKIISTLYFPFDLVQNTPALPFYCANIRHARIEGI